MQGTFIKLQLEIGYLPISSFLLGTNFALSLERLILADTPTPPSSSETIESHLLIETKLSTLSRQLVCLDCVSRLLIAGLSTVSYRHSASD